MKKFLSILCLLILVALLSACNNGDNGSKGSTIPDVAWDLIDDLIVDNYVTCYNASKSVVTNPFQTCEWNCASLDGSPPRYYKLTFLYDEATGDTTIENIQRGKCRL